MSEQSMTQAEQETELKANGWRPVEVHSNPIYWRDPEGLLYPITAYAHSIMKQRAAEESK
jgi:hypothetical protein